MEGTITLRFIRPVGNGIGISRGGAFGAPRPYGPHKGADFMAPMDTQAVACESGRIVFSGMVEGSAERTSYGNVVVIDHTPDADELQRHIYSLYAHLNGRSVYTGETVEKGYRIGMTGNSGMKGTYSKNEKERKKNYHLHFEIIDTAQSPRSLPWGGDCHPLSLRKDPTGYIGKSVTLLYGPWFYPDLPLQ